MTFRTSTRWLLPTIVASVAAGRLALAPTAPAWAKATTSTTVETIPVTFDTFSCGGVEEGELIDLEGDIRSVSHLTIEPHGGIHLETQVQFSLVGVGEITGTIYRFNNAEHSKSNPMTLEQWRLSEAWSG